MSTMEWFKISMELLSSAGIIIASIVAISGINSWRHELRGRKLYELAEEVLSLFYEARDKIDIIRLPFSSKDEGKTRQQGESETEEEKIFYDRAYIVFERYNRYKDIFNKIRTIRYRFKANFGKEKILPFAKLDDVISRIFNASINLGDLLVEYREGVPGPERAELGKKISKCKAIIWARPSDEWAGSDPDPIEEEIKQIILDIEDICEPILGEKAI